jgi:hypothetical protein
LGLPDDPEVVAREALRLAHENPEALVRRLHALHAEWDHLLTRLRQVCGAIAILSAARAAVTGAVEPRGREATPPSRKPERPQP